MTATRPSCHADAGHPRSVRAIALGITGALHVVAVAVAAVAFSWQSPGGDAPGSVPPPVIIPLRAQDHRRDLPKTGAARPAATPALVPVKAAPAPVAPLAASGKDQQIAAAEADPGGRRDDAAQQVALAYRRAILARIEAQRRYPDDALRRGWEGSGALIFRIERSGRLLDVAVAQSTRRPTLDAAVTAMVRRAGPFPEIPEGLPDELAITLPVEFLIHDAAAP